MYNISSWSSDEAFSFLDQDGHLQHDRFDFINPPYVGQFVVEEKSAGKKLSGAGSNYWILIVFGDEVVHRRDGILARFNRYVICFLNLKEKTPEVDQYAASKEFSAV